MTIESVRGVSDTGPDDLWSRIGRDAMPRGYARMTRADVQAATLDRGDPPRIEAPALPPGRHPLCFAGAVNLPGSGEHTAGGAGAGHDAARRACHGRIGDNSMIEPHR